MFLLEFDYKFSSRWKSSHTSDEHGDRGEAADQLH